MATLAASQVYHRFLVLQGLRWLPRGIPVPVLVLLPLERGLTLAQIGTLGAALGVVVLVLELPTGGLADVLGRKPVLMAATLVNMASLGTLFFADSLSLFVLAFVLLGVFQALDSGPLEAWYVDSALAADAEADIERGLSRAGLVIGVAVGAGALLGGGLVALGGFDWISGFTLPVLAAFVLQALSLLAAALLVVEQRRPRVARARLLSEASQAVRDAIGLARRSSIVLALISVELLWGFGLVSIETLFPLRLAEVMGDAGRAGAILGPANAGAWLGAALGAALVPLAIRWLGSPWTGFALRLAQGGAVVAVALLAGPVGVLAAFFLCYVINGAANPVHMALLHRQVDGTYRSTCISLNSMVGRLGFAAGAVVLTTLAGATSVRSAMLVGAVVLAIAAPLYLPSLRTRTLGPSATPPATG